MLLEVNFRFILDAHRSKSMASLTSEAHRPVEAFDFEALAERPGRLSREMPRGSQGKELSQV